MIDHGTRTEDLTRYQPATTLNDHSSRRQRFARANYAAGITLATVNIITALCTAILGEGQAFTDPDAILFANLTCIAVMALASALIVVGAHASRSIRTEAMIDANRRRIEQLAGEIHDIDVHLHPVTAFVGGDLPRRISDGEAQLAAIAETIKSLPERLDRIEKVIEQVPDYTDAVIQGITLRRNVVGPDGL